MAQWRRRHIGGVVLVALVAFDLPNPITDPVITFTGEGTRGWLAVQRDRSQPGWP